MTLSPKLAAIVSAKKGEHVARSEIVKRLWAFKLLIFQESVDFISSDPPLKMTYLIYNGTNLIMKNY